MGGRRTTSIIAALTLVVTTACGTASAPRITSAAPSTVQLSATGEPAHTSPPPTLSSSRTAGVPTVAQLPRGGTTIIGRYRVVAYYGGPDGPGLGVLGSLPPERIASAIEQRARQWAGRGLPVQPAMELIGTVAQGSPGANGEYSAAISPGEVRRYLDVAHRHRMLLILDFQPGRGEFLPQVQAFARFLADPSVSVALDPEWKMHGNQVPGTVIGSSSAASVLAVRDYLSTLVAAKHLPDKLLMVHQFTTSMVPGRQRITPARGVEIVFHADGFGTRAQKDGTWHALDFAGRPYGTGFKLFLRQDTDMMGPDAVLARAPRPDVITYQ